MSFMLKNPSFRWSLVSVRQMQLCNFVRNVLSQKVSNRSTKKRCLLISKRVVYVTIGNPAFCLALILTGVHFQGELHHVGDASDTEIKYRPIRTRETGGAKLSEELYAKIALKTSERCHLTTSYLLEVTVQTHVLNSFSENIYQFAIKILLSVLLSSSTARNFNNSWLLHVKFQKQ